jgi:hypothetical protein
MSGLRQQVPFFRRRMMRRNLSRWYSPRTTARTALIPANGTESVIVNHRAGFRTPLPESCLRWAHQRGSC